MMTLLLLMVCGSCSGAFNIRSAEVQHDIDVRETRSRFATLFGSSLVRRAQFWVHLLTIFYHKSYNPEILAG